MESQQQQSGGHVVPPQDSAYDWFENITMQQVASAILEVLHHRPNETAMYFNEEELCHWHFVSGHYEMDTIKLMLQVIHQNTSNPTAQAWLNEMPDIIRKRKEYNGSACDYEYDGAENCWPRTPVNQTALGHCPGILFGDNVNGVSKRTCGGDARWRSVDYTECQQHLLPSIHTQIQYYIYGIGYTVSLVFLLCAILCFLKYKHLWCTRNKIHVNFLIAFALRNVTFILYIISRKTAHSLEWPLALQIVCAIFPLILKYNIAATFSWMFMEGLYLFLSVMYSFKTEILKLWMFMTFGWGMPLLMFIITIVPFIERFEPEKLCDMQHADLIDYLYLAPIFIVLIVNVIFLIVILYVISTKLQKSGTVEIQRYKKILKGLLILSPLLGVNHLLLVFAQPGGHNVTWQLFFTYYTTIVSSTQGALVAIIICFRNQEVTEALWVSVRRQYDMLSTKHYWMRRSYLGDRLLLSKSMSLDQESIRTCGTRASFDVTPSSESSYRNFADEIETRDLGAVPPRKSTDEAHQYLTSAVV